MKRFVKKLVTLLLLLCASGYLSNALSKEECQKEVAGWISKKLLAGKEFFLLPDRIEPSMTVFKAIGARVQNPPPMAHVHGLRLARPRAGYRLL